ncbi:MAG TPA: DUF401 family protein [Bacillota bacterium]|nr:DUF401 family protein [Bacillota bacterium]HNT03358.1 DUF401 family protein [Bacillota bacterium]HQO43474.1 DUF401 family protein [Bacillota bacterium]HQQ43651.1 DUF401 family protein [Bacillota bacterium]
MQEFFAVIGSFLIIPVLSRKKVPLGIAICACAVLMALLGGLGAFDFANVISNTFFNFNKVQQLLVVAEFSIIGVLLKKYKIIDEVLDNLTKVIKNEKAILMLIPALIGMLTVPGGAIMSVPLVDQLGERSNISKPHRAIINLVFRHIPMNILPYATSFLVVASISPRISIYKLIGLNSIFMMMYFIAAYYIYIRKAQSSPSPHYSFEWINLVKLLKFTSPIYVAVLLNLLLGVPFYLGVLVNLLIVYLIHPTKTFLMDSLRAFSFNVLYALIGVYLIQGIMGRMESLNSFLASILMNPNTIILGIIAASMFFGITTGFSPTALGVILPILITLPLSDNMLLMYCHFTFCWAFVGYFFSPMHLCQIFTCEYLKVSIGDLYKDYWKFFVSLATVLVLNYFVMGLFLR